MIGVNVWRDCRECVAWMCDVIGVNVWLECAMWLAWMCDMIGVNVWRDWRECVAWLAWMCGRVTGVNVWCDWRKCVTWLCDDCTWHHKTLVQLYWHLAIKLYCIRDGGREGVGEEYLWIARPRVPTRKDGRDRQPWHRTINVKGDGDAATAKQHVYSATCSFNSCAEQSHKDTEQRHKDTEQSQRHGTRNSHKDTEHGTVTKTRNRVTRTRNRVTKISFWGSTLRQDWNIWQTIPVSTESRRGCF